jgi:penicillin-binding protein 2B
MKKKTLRFNVGALLMFFIFGVLFLLLMGRIAYIQATGVVNGHELQVEAATKYQRQSTLTADRGKILDRNGTVIAEDTLSYKVIAVVSPKATTNLAKPYHVIDPEETAKKLAEIISLDEQAIYKILTKDGDPYQVEFGQPGKGLTYDQKHQIEELNLPGLLIVSEKKRFYPNGSFAAHLIGYADKEEKTGETVGKMGIEKIYNEQLTGTNGKINFNADRKGYLLPNTEKMVEAAQDGSNIYLTLDKTIQNFLDEAMTRVYEEYAPSSMVGIVADPKTGEILAMSQRPTFDPVTREGLTASWLNETIENIVEPGSTMKVFTVASAMDTNNWHPNMDYQSGKYVLYDKTIRDHNYGRGWGKITYLEGFQRSSNTAMAHQLEIMGRDTFLSYLDRFGFGEKTGIDLPKETSGTIISKYPAEVLTTTYGQGSTVTPMQMIQAFTAVANDGEMMQPYVIDKIVNPNTDEVVMQSKPTPKGTPIKKDTAEQMKQLLASTVTSEHGTAKRFALEGYTVGGKTGTAQISAGKGSYTFGDSNSYLYSFLGMAPVEDPQFIMYVYVKEPKLKENEAGSEPVSQVFKSVMQNSLMYYNIKPSNAAEASFATVNDYTGKHTEAVTMELATVGIQSVVIGEEGKVTRQYPSANTKLMKGNLMFVKTEGAITLPDFTGWSLRNLLIYKQLSNLPIEIIGEGYAISQSVSKDVVITSDTGPIVIQLMTPEQSLNAPTVEPEVEAEAIEE